MPEFGLHYYNDWEQGIPKNPGVTTLAENGSTGDLSTSRVDNSVEYGKAHFVRKSSL
jgi:hypothetical protein